MSPVIVPEIRTTPSLLRTTFDSHQIPWDGPVEAEQEVVIADMKEEIEAENRPG